MIKKILKVSFFRKLIVSISIRLLKLLKKNRGYFDINGFMMYLDFLDPIDRSIILDGSYEKEEINKLNNFIIKISIYLLILVPIVDFILLISQIKISFSV